MFFKLNHVPIVLYISKVMGGSKLRFRHIKNARKRGTLVVAIPRAQVHVPATEGLTLSVPVPEIISVQPSKRVCCIKILSAIHVSEPLVRIRSRIARVN